MHTHSWNKLMLRSDSREIWKSENYSNTWVYKHINTHHTNFDIRELVCREIAESRNLLPHSNLYRLTPGSYEHVCLWPVRFVCTDECIYMCTYVYFPKTSRCVCTHASSTYHINMSLRDESLSLLRPLVMLLNAFYYFRFTFRISILLSSAIPSMCSPAPPLGFVGS